jgi:hypothetical protein
MTICHVITFASFNMVTKCYLGAAVAGYMTLMYHSRCVQPDVVVHAQRFKCVSGVKYIRYTHASCIHLYSYELQVLVKHWWSCYSGKFTATDISWSCSTCCCYNRVLLLLLSDYIVQALNRCSTCKYGYCVLYRMQWSCTMVLIQTYNATQCTSSIRLIYWDICHQAWIVKLCCDDWYYFCVLAPMCIDTSVEVVCHCYTTHISDKQQCIINPRYNHVKVLVASCCAL